MKTAYTEEYHPNQNVKEQSIQAKPDLMDEKKYNAVFIHGVEVTKSGDASKKSFLPVKSENRWTGW